MILFKEDWARYPAAIPDVKTRNTSFIRICALYREMGVDNHLWPLALMDPDLQGVDPYDPSLTPALMIKISIECKENPIYFFREIARDPAGSDDYPILFRANRGNLSAFWLFFCHVVIFLIMIRQTGKSFSIDWLYTYLLNIRLTKSEISQLTKDEKLRGRELERLKSMELTLPHYLKQRGPRDPGNTEVLKIGALDNYFKSYVPNKSPKIADTIGRGMTSSIVGVDELAYIFNNFITIPVMLSATSAAREVAAIKNEPYGTLFTTTTGKRDTPEGKYAYKLVSGAAIWSEKLMDATNLEDLHQRVIAASPSGNLHVNCTFNHQQLGFTDDWLRNRIRASLNDEDVAIEADYLNQWPSGTLKSPFTKDVAELIRASENLEPLILFSDPENYTLRWYYRDAEIRLKMQDPHILSVDPSEAIGKDSIGITLRSVITGEVAMAADISEANIMKFSKWLACFLRDYLSVTLIIERRSTGPAIVDALLLYLPAMGINPFRRIYNTIVQNADEEPERFKTIQSKGMPREDILMTSKRHFGFATSASGTTSRSMLYGRTMSAAAKMTGALIRDRPLILELLGLEITASGRIDHTDGGHDDLVISWLLSYWLLSSGKNLTFYGIEPGLIFSENPSFRAQLQERSAYEQDFIKLTRARIQELSEQLKSERDEYVAKRLEYDLELNISRLPEDERQVLVADDLINKLRDERSRQARRAPYTPGTDYSGYGLSNQGLSGEVYHQRHYG